MSDKHQPYVIGGSLPLNQQDSQPQETAAGTSVPPPSQQHLASAAPLTPPASDPPATDAIIGQSPAHRRPSRHHSETPRSTYPSRAPTSAPEQQFSSTPSKGFSSQSQAGHNHESLRTASSVQRGTQDDPPLPLPPPQPIMRPAASVSSRFRRGPHMLTAYVVPFPKPQLGHTSATGIPNRFLIYTPLYTNAADTLDRTGVRRTYKRGFVKAVGLASTTNVEFLHRLPISKEISKREENVGAGHKIKGPGLHELVLTYPASYNATPEEIKTEFINSMMRTKSKAERDAVLALLFLLAQSVLGFFALYRYGMWVVDGVWLYSSLYGAKTATSITERLAPSVESGQKHRKIDDREMQSAKLDLKFQQDPQVDVLYKYLCRRCAVRDPLMFPNEGIAVTESEVLEAIGWAPSQAQVRMSWEDEQWETFQVQDDLRRFVRKGAGEWNRWCKKFVSHPEKALKK